jgi:hypothetical protein
VKTFFLLPCSCGNKVPIERAQAGEKIRCPCGAELDVPTMQAIGRLDPAPDDAPAEQAASRWGLWQGLVLLGAVIMLPALGWVAYLLMTWPKLVDIDALSPAQTLLAWNILRGDVARPGLPGDKQVLDARQMVRRWMTVAVVIGCTGMATVAGSLLLVRPRRRPRSGLS